jgi:CheY-like chemotaxis protein
VQIARNVTDIRRDDTTLCERPRRPGATLGASLALPPARKGRRYLVAEDDAPLRRLLATMLRQGGAEVVEATDGADLLSWIEQAARSSDREVFDAIVSDIQMPKLTALDVLRTFPGVSRRAPVILITAFGEKQVREEAYDLGAVAVLQKPLHLGDVHAIVRAVSRVHA